MSQTPQSATNIDSDHPYAKAAAQLNKLIRGGKSLSGHERNCMFLNLGGKDFANVSALTGFDFADDGRAIAQCDWDFDGDLDFWVANRTAPQVRFLQNQVGQRNHFVAFRLQGTTSNRDAIGARVEIQLQGSDKDSRIVQGLRAGEGFLAQSSKLVHFGLGQATRISDLTVHWPNGNVEKCPPPENVNQFFTIVEGKGVLEPWSPKTKHLVDAPHPPQVPDESPATANPLALPFPMPPLSCVAKAGAVADATDRSGTPLLINLWATWCEPCMEELSEWQEHSQRFTNNRIEVLAISVDGADQSSVDIGTVENHLRQRGINFHVSLATESALDALQLVHDAIYDHHQRLPVPTSLLLDGDGNLIAIYKGQIDSQRIVDDLERAKNPDPDSRLPFRGRWIGRLGPYRFAKLVADLWDSGLKTEAVAYANRLDGHSESESVKARLSLAYRFKQDKKPQESMTQLQSAYKIAPKDPDVNLQIGLLIAEHGSLQRAAGHLLLALENSPEPRADIHANLGEALRRLKKTEDAQRHLETAIELDPTIGAAYHGLGLICAAANRHQEAVFNLSKAVELESGNTSFRINYALALSKVANHQAAIAALDIVLQQDPASVTAQIYKGEVYAEAKRFDEAITAFQQVVATHPKADRVWMRLGQVQEQHGLHRDAIRSYEQITRISPEDFRAPARIAWLLATSPDDSLRDGHRAVRLAEQADSFTKSRDPIVLDILAAAYAGVSDFPNAIATCERAIRQLGDSQSTFRHELEGRLQEYRDGQPFRSQ
ncbi:MAG: tetratricopeptide repeat protein [Planctomycetales bacterium]|nr:tetratricopeptide repeat protein [Planctomycetales bacterium]